MEYIDDLSLVQPDEAKAQQTCGPYYYLVLRRHASFTAFCTREAFLKWLTDLNLNLTDTLTDEGKMKTQRIEGGFYSQCCFRDTFQQIASRSDAKPVPVMSNGTYTVGYVHPVEGDIMGVTYLNPNVSDRPYLDREAGLRLSLEIR